MKKIFKILPLSIVASLTACMDVAHSYPSDTFFCFDTVVTVKTLEYHGLMYSVVVQDRTCEILKEIDAISDAYKKRDVACIYDLNNTNEKIEIDSRLYKLLSLALEIKDDLPYFNPLIGSLSNKWKDALSKNEILSDSVIQEELEKMNNSSLILEMIPDGYEHKHYAQRVGEALIDVGAIAKGFALDQCEAFLKDRSEPEYEYSIDAGSSSILLGNNFDHDHKLTSFKVKLKELSEATYLYLDNCYISTSGTSEQGVKIGDQTYSHIINPNDGSAINNYDAVVVITDFSNENNGLLGDALSTSLMMSSLEEIKQLEEEIGFKTLVIKDDSVIYQSKELELHHG